ncbi:hypothetical protein EL80_5150 [Escherichia coli]|nr:hypothetical protein EL80_5150 [Escherichia coli]
MNNLNSVVHRPEGIVPSDGVLFHQKESDRGFYVFAFYYWLLASSESVRFAGTSLSAGR